MPRGIVCPVSSLNGGSSLGNGWNTISNSSNNALSFVSSTFVLCSDANEGCFSSFCFCLICFFLPLFGRKAYMGHTVLACFGGYGKLCMRNKLVFNFQRLFVNIHNRRNGWLYQLPQCFPFEKSDLLKARFPILEYSLGRFEPRFANNGINVWCHWDHQEPHVCAIILYAQFGLNCSQHFIILPSSNGNVLFRGSCNFCILNRIMLQNCSEMQFAAAARPESNRTLAFAPARDALKMLVNVSLSLSTRGGSCQILDLCDLMPTV